MTDSLFSKPSRPSRRMGLRELDELIHERSPPRARRILRELLTTDPVPPRRIIQVRFPSPKLSYTIQPESLTIELPFVDYNDDAERRLRCVDGNFGSQFTRRGGSDRD